MLPVLFKNSNFPIFLYPLLMGIACGVGFYFSKSNYEKHPNSINSFYFMFWGSIASAWIGAKLFFLMFSAGEMSDVYIQSSNFWLGGGFVFFGGLVFGLLFLVLYAQVFKQMKLRDIYLFVPALTLSHGIGRIGCFLAGCCYGAQCDLPWAVHMHEMDRHPVQLYEALFLFGLTYFIQKLIDNKSSWRFVLSSYFIFYGIWRFLVEYLRADLIRGFYLNISTSQYVSIGLIILGSIIFVLRPKKIN